MNNDSDVAKGAHYDNLSRDELIAKNKELRQIIRDFRYKELDEKLVKAIIEQEKNQEIDRLVDTIAQANKEIQSCRQDNYNLKSRNIDLERVIQKQNVILDLAAGYISTSKRFSNTHPMDVKKWLMGGME